MDTKTCKFCNKEIGAFPAAFARHNKVCEKLYSNEEYIISSYNNGKSITSLCKEFSFDCKMIRRFLTDNNVTILNSRNTVNHHFFKTKTSEMFWLLGLIASDGCIKSKYSWGISQSGSRGLKLIQYINSIINSSNKIYTSETIGKDAHQINISSEEMVKDLAKYGIFPRKTHTFNLPEFECEEHFKSFIRGYIDGDGCVGVYSNIEGCEYLSISFVGNKSFIDSCVSKLPFKISSTTKLSGVWDIRYTGEKSIIFGNWVYSNNSLYSHYKYEKYMDYISEKKDLLWSNYNKIYMDIKHRLLSENIPMLAKDIGVHFQTLYNWKNNPKNIVNINGFYCTY